MSEANPTPATEDPPPLVNGESVASDKSSTEKHGPEESREVAVTSNDCDQVNNGCENATEGTADEDANIGKADDTNRGDPGYANVVGAVDVNTVDTQHEASVEAVDVKMVDTQHEASVEAVDVKLVDTQHEANIEVEDVKMVDTQHEASIEADDVKMVVTQHEANIEAKDVKMVGTEDVKLVHTQHKTNIKAEEDACQDKGGKNGNNQHAKATEGEDIKMVEAKADARNAEARDRQKDVCQKKNHTNIEEKDMKMVDKEVACQKEDKEGKNEDCLDAEVAEADEMKIIEAKTDVRNAEVNENGKREEMEDKVKEKKNNTNIEDDDMKTVDKKVACQKEGEGSNEDSHDAKVAEGDEIKMVVAKTDAGNAVVEENGKNEEKDEKTEEENNNANIKTEELVVYDKDNACWKEDKKVKNEDIQEANKADGEDMKIVEGKTDARIAEVIENRKNGETEDNAEEKENDANVEAENLIIVDKDACQNKDKEGKTDDSQDAKAAEGEDIKMVEAKSDAGNAVVKENGKKGEKEEQNEETANGINNQADEVKIVGNEACQKEDRERKNEDSHSANAAEGEEIMVVGAKAAAVHEEVKENEKNDEYENKTEEKQNDNKKESISVEKQDGDKMEPVEVDKQEMDNREQIGVEKQDGSKQEKKGCFHKHEVIDSQQSVKERQEGLEDEERVHEVEKDGQDGAVAKQEGAKQDVNVAAENKEEEKQDVKLIAEEKDKTLDGKVAAEKKEEVNKIVAFEKNTEIVIEMGVSEKDEDMETNGKTTVDKQDGKKANQIDDICKQEGQKKGTKRSKADMEETENGSASRKDKDGEVAVEDADESDKNMEGNKDEAPKSKKARIVREDDHKKDKKKDGSKSREAKDLLNTPSHYSLDRPARARKTVERLVEAIEKDPSGSFIVEKGRGTPLKNIPGVAYRISRKKSADLKFLHQILFGRFGKAVDFKSHVLEFSGFVWHGSDEKHRAKAKEKLDKCFKDTLLDLCNLLAIPVSRVDSEKEDIVTKLLDFIAEPHANDDSTLSDDKGSNSRKRIRGSAAKNPEGTHKKSRKELADEHTSRKRQQKYFELEFDEDGAEEGHEEDEHMKSGSEENKDDGEEADGEHEDKYDSREVKTSKRSMEGKGSSAKRKAITGSVPKTAPLATLSKCSSRVSSSKSSKDKQSSAEDSNSRKKESITPKHTENSQKETNLRRSSGKGLTASKGKSTEAKEALPSKDELQNTIVEVLKKVNFNTATFSDILKMLDGHYKMDLSSRKEAIKHMVNGELIKIAEADED